MPHIYVIGRPSQTPTVPVALGARSVAWGVFKAGEHEDHRVQNFVKVLWSVGGVGKIHLERGAYELPAQSVAIFFPGMRHEAQAAADGWDVRWFTFNGPLCEAVARACGFAQAGVYPAGPAPVEIFEQLREVIADPTPQSERRADALAYALLVAASLGAARGTPLIEEAKSQIQRGWSDANFGIEGLARALGVHRSRLSRLFVAEIGVSPMRYLSDLRLHHALNLLMTTEMTVAQIAHRCGYNDASHFCRVFRQAQGLTPGQYRRK